MHHVWAVWLPNPYDREAQGVGLEVATFDALEGMEEGASQAAHIDGVAFEFAGDGGAVGAGFPTLGAPLRPFGFAGRVVPLAEMKPRLGPGGARFPRAIRGPALGWILGRFRHCAPLAYCLLFYHRHAPSSAYAFRYFMGFSYIGERGSCPRQAVAQGVRFGVAHFANAGQLRWEKYSR